MRAGINNLAYGLFMAEKNGYLDTHESHVNKAIKDFEELARCGYTPFMYQDSVFKRNNIDKSKLSDRDRRRIERVMGGGRIK